MTNVKVTLGEHTISLEDLEKAENTIISQTQKQYFQEEGATLMVTKGLKKTSNIYNLDPVLKDSVLRVEGHLSRAAMPEETKFPVIFPNCRGGQVKHIRYDNGTNFVGAQRVQRSLPFSEPAQNSRSLASKRYTVDFKPSRSIPPWRTMGMSLKIRDILGRLLEVMAD